MAKVVVPDYEKDLNRALTQVVNIVHQDVNATKIALEQELSRLNDGFYRVLARKIIGSSAPPDLGAYTPPAWKPLAAKTISRKGHGEFYRDTYALNRWLHQANANEIIGEPEVEIRTGGKTGSIKGRVLEIFRVSSSGRKWVQKIGVGPGGRFVSTKELERELKPSLVIYPFGSENASFAGGTTAKLLSGGDAQIAYKLSNYKGKEDRPIASYFLSWWLNIQTRRVVEKYTK